MIEVNFRMLVLAREARGLTQSELVVQIPNLTQGNYSRMEKGILPIPYEALSNISNILKFPLSFFEYNKPIKNQAEYYYRKRATMPRKQQVKLEANFDLLRIWIDSLLNDIDIPDFSIPPIEVENNNSPEAIARKIRSFLSLPKGPIDKLVKTLERSGIIIYFLKDAPEKFDGTTIVTNSGQHIIVVNDNLPNDRKRFTIAHEFGHIIMHLSFSPIIDSNRNTEAEADRFASEFLMPELDIRRDLTYFRFNKLGDLKAFWKVSKAALIRRAFTLRFIDQSKYNSMMIEMSRLGERKQESGKVELDQPSIITLIINSYFEHLDYSKEELSKIIRISVDDFDYLLLGKGKEIPKLRIAV